MPVKILPPTPSAYAYPLLIKQLLLTPLATAPEQEISYQGRGRYSYRTFYQRLQRLARGLVGLGCEAGQTVAVMDWDSHRYLECFFAVPMLGAVLQTVNVRLSPDQILYTLNHAQADILLIHQDFLPILDKISPALSSVKTWVLLTDDAQDLPPTMQTEYEAMLATAAPQFDFPDFDENAQATTFYTTGTTGNPKGVHFSHRQLVLHTLGCAAALGGASAHGQVQREDVYMPLTPMFHVHAWGMPYLATMLGLKQVYPGRYQLELIVRLVKEEGVTFSHCVPTVLHMVLSQARGVDFSGWKIVIGGSALPEAMVLAAQQQGIDLFGGYGMSETCPVLSISHLTREELARAPGEVVRLRAKAGRPLPLVDLRVVDEQLNDVAHDGIATGEVVVRAPWLTQSYVGAPEASEVLWTGGYLHTADIGNIDAAGFLKVTDRIKDVIKTGGEWASSLQIEDIIAKHPAVQEVAVIGIPDEKWGERPLALVVLKPEHVGQVTEAAIRHYATHAIEAAGVSRYGILLHVRFAKTLLKTSVGKLNKRLMRENPAALFV